MNKAPNSLMFKEVQLTANRCILIKTWMARVTLSKMFLVIYKKGFWFWLWTKSCAVAHSRMMPLPHPWCGHSISLLCSPSLHNELCYFLHLGPLEIATSLERLGTVKEIKDQSYLPALVTKNLKYIMLHLKDIFVTCNSRIN